MAQMAALYRGTVKTHSGVWRGLWVRGRNTEIDMQIGPIAKYGARHGIDCRTTRRLIEMIHEAEHGARAMSDDNLLELARSV